MKSAIARLGLACLAGVGQLALAGTAGAQTAAPADHDGRTPPDNSAPPIAEIQITGTRIVREGFVAPTPVTSMTTQDMQLGGVTDIGQALVDLPLAKGTTTPRTDSNGITTQGFNIPDLRGLGVARTLVLINGERPVAQTISGFDLNTIPISLIQRVDVITGGASAAYGSGAVSGVINVVLNSGFVGERADVQYGQNEAGYGDSYKASLAFGRNFGSEDRGHFMIAGQRTHTALITAGDVPEYQNNIIQNPGFAPGNGQSQYLLVPNYNYSSASLGGVIPSGPLQGTAFGTGGTPYSFQYGDYANSTFMSGGDAQAAGVTFPGQVIQAEGNHTHLYSELSYTTSNEVTMKADVLYSDYHSVSPFATNSTNNGIGGPFTIKDTNAFLPSSIAAQMALNGVTSFPLGRIDSDFGGLNGTVTDTMDTHTYWASVSADGTFGRSWRWNLFYNHGATDTRVVTGPMQLTDLLAASVDSVMSGGKAVCANTALKNPITGASCVPVNLFGFGSPSPEALAYFSADSYGYWNIGQNEAGGQLQGDPFSSWAGPVSLAAGVEWRTNSLNLHGDPLAKAGRFNRQNFPTIIGHDSVVEGFAETVVPLLKDKPAAQELDFNAAVRESHYSTSGSVNSWKFGATDRVTREILLRGTYSQDIRAPTVSELFTVRTTNFGSVIDPEKGNATVPVTIFRGGNTRLEPEKARSLTYGLVYTPEWLPSFNLSVDWYAIHMRDTVTAASQQKLVDYCFAGVAAACANVVRDGSGNITAVNSNNINLDELSTSGLDVEATHHWELGDVSGGLRGTLDSHLLANYVHEMVGKDGTTSNESLGVLSNVGNAPSQLRWRATLTEIYDLNRFEGYMRLRYLSGGLYQNAVTLNENHVGGQYYVDLGASYFLTDDKRFQVYGNVVNAFDRSPPKYASAVAAFYDIFGTTYNVGLRATF